MGNDTDRSGGRPGTPPSPAARSKVNTHEERENRSEQMRRKEERRKELRNSERRRKEWPTLFRCGQFDLFPDASLSALRKPSACRRRGSASHRRGHHHAPQSAIQIAIWTPRSAKRESSTRIPFPSLMATALTLGRTRTASSRCPRKGI